jgi:tol-pal system protein YbgF
MNAHRLLVAVVVVLALLAPTPGFAASKEIIQLQTQVQQLQDQMSRMQQSFDERMGVMRALIETQTDVVNKLNASLENLQKSMGQQQNDFGQKNDQVSGQIQSLNDSLDELKARLAKISTQLDQIGTAQQNIPQQTAPAAQPAAQAPPADVLYNNALRDYNAGKLDLASQQFVEYLKYYPTTELAGNAQFYVADIEYRQQNFSAAVQDYDKVLEQYPGGNKTAAAQLKKGLSLVQLGKKDAAVRELNAVIQRYPRSIEATTARDQLRKLGVSASGKPSAARR